MTLKRYWPILLCMIVVTALGASDLFRNMAMYGLIHADAQGYYGYLIAIFLEQSFDWQQVIDSYSTTYFDGQASDFTVESEFGSVNKYYMGTALLFLPFFLLSCLAAAFGGFPIDGYSVPFQAGALLAAIFYICVGLVFLVRFLENKGISWGVSMFVAITCYLASGLFHYSISEPLMSHAYSFFLFCAFLWTANKALEQKSLKSIIWATMIFALIVLVRPSNGLVVLSLPFIAGGGKELLQKIQSIQKLPRSVLIAAITFLVIVSMQSATYFLQVGKPVVWSYQGEGFNFSEPEIMNVLFSFRKGFFVYTPWAILGAIGLFVALYKRTKEGIMLWLFLATSLYVISSWWNWYYGSSMGMRSLIEYLPFFAYGLAILLENSNKLVKGVVMILAVLSIPVNMVQAYQYNRFILHWDRMDKERFVKVFLKTDRKYEGIFYREERVIYLPPEENVASRVVEFYDFEDGAENTPEETLAYSGNNSTHLNESITFGKALHKPVSEMGPEGKKMLHLTFMVWSDQAFPNLTFGYSYRRADEQDYGHTYIPVGHGIPEEEKWVKVEEYVELGVPESEEDLWVIYPYSPHETQIYIDDIRYEIITLKPEV